MVCTLYLVIRIENIICSGREIHNSKQLSINTLVSKIVIALWTITAYVYKS
jgi:hypothetical protein